MRNAARSIAGVAIVLAAAGFSARGAAQPAPEEVCVTCYHPQSPRRLTAVDWNWTSRIPAVSRRNADSILYSPRVGVPLRSSCLQPALPLPDRELAELPGPERVNDS